MTKLINSEGALSFGTIDISETTKIRACRINSMLTITNVWTKVDLDSQTFDKLGEFDPATGVIRVMYPGYYQINAQARFEGTTDGRYNAAIYINGVLSVYAEQCTGSAVTPYPSVFVHHLALLAAGDNINLYVRQITGGNVNLNVGPTGVFIDVVRIL